MSVINIYGEKPKKMYIDGLNAKAAYYMCEKVWSAGSIVTYICNDVTYQEYVDSGNTVLSPTSFTPEKSGWTFAGWREDNTASGSVLSSKVMEDSPMTLYAVFKQTVTVTYYNNSTAASSTSGYRYYNNGNIVNPSFTLTQASRSGWTARGWSTGSAGNSGITYNNGATFTRDSNVTLYGMWYQQISLSYNGNGAGSGSVATQTGNVYLSPGFSQVNPTFTLASNGFTKSGFSFNGWNLGAAGATVTLSSSSIAYAQWKEISIGISSTYVNSYDRTVSCSATLAANKTYYVCAFASGGGASHGSINWSISNVSASVSGGSLSNIMLRGVRYSYPADDRPNTAAISYRVDKVVTGSANRTYTATFTNGGAYLVAAQLSLVFVDATLASSLSISDVYAYAVSSTATSASLSANSLYYVISYGNAGVNQWGGYPGTNWVMNAVGMSASSGTLTNITSIGPIYCTAYSDGDQEAGAAMSYKVGKVLTSSAASTVTSSASAGGAYRNDTQMSTIILKIA